MVPTLIIIGLLVAIAALFYTLRIGKFIDSRKSELDPEAKATHRHPFLFNPIFLAYIIGFGGLLIFILYLTMSTNWF